MKTKNRHLCFHCYWNLVVISVVSDRNSDCQRPTVAYDLFYFDHAFVLCGDAALPRKMNSPMNFLILNLLKMKRTLLMFPWTIVLSLVEGRLKEALD